MTLTKVRNRIGVFALGIIIVLSTIPPALAPREPRKVRVIIGFKGDIDASVASRQGGKVLRHLSAIRAIAASLPEGKIGKIRGRPGITYVELDSPVFALQEQLPWGVDRIDAEKVHPYNKGSGVKVALIDTGIDHTHPDLDANYKGGYDFANNDDDPMDDNGHGTHCAGIIAAEDNEFGVIGVAPEAYLYAVKVLDSTGSGYVSDVVAGIEWAIDNGMQVISMSLGSNSDSQALHDACDAAYGAGIVLVAAAGNDYKAWGRWWEWDTVDYPARYGSVIAVGATDHTDTKASWSSTGPALELAAPGVEIVSTYLGGYAYGSGTSMACPHVSGTAALVIASNPLLSNVEVRTQLQETADDLGEAGRDYWYGYGLADADEAAPQPAEPNTPPVADADGPYMGTEDIKVTFDGSKSSDADGDPLTYSWDFGDGKKGDGVSPTHTYVAGGTYTVTLIVNDGKVDSDPSTTTATIIEVNDPPVADAGSDQLLNDADGSGLETATLDGSASHDPDGTIVSYKWTEGPTILGTEAIITAEFALGTHTVTLTVQDDEEAIDSDEVVVTVEPNQGPIADAGPDQSAYVGDLVTFDGSNSYDIDGSILSYDWDFGDGVTKTGVTTTHRYMEAGIYTVTLTVEDDGGLTDTDTSTVTISEKPAQPTMHVKNIEMVVVSRWRGWRVYATATVAICDAAGSPVEGATVSGHWEDATTDTDSATTGPDGKVTLTSDALWRPPAKTTFTFVVDDVAKDGWIYDQGANAKTSDSVTYS